MGSTCYGFSFPFHKIGFHYGFIKVIIIIINLDEELSSNSVTLEFTLITGL